MEIQTHRATQPYQTDAGRRPRSRGWGGGADRTPAARATARRAHGAPRQTGEVTAPPDGATQDGSEGHLGRRRGADTGGLGGGATREGGERRIWNCNENNYPGINEARARGPQGRQDAGGRSWTRCGDADKYRSPGALPRDPGLPQTAPNDENETRCSSQAPLGMRERGSYSGTFWNRGG